MPFDDETRALLEQPDFQEMVASILPPEARNEFESMVAKNAAILSGAGGGGSS
jgi:hypothetical protein